MENTVSSTPICVSQVNLAGLRELWRICWFSLGLTANPVFLMIHLALILHIVVFLIKLSTPCSFFPENPLLSDHF